MPAPFRSTRDIILRTARFDEAVAFYEQVMGFAVTLRREDLVGFETGAFQLFVERGPSPHAAVLEMKVSDVDASVTTLAAAGCEVVERDATLPRCYVRDPFGLVFNLDRE